jgi:hypothetical protein
VCVYMSVDFLQRVVTNHLGDAWLLRRQDENLFLLPEKKLLVFILDSNPFRAPVVVLTLLRQKLLPAKICQVLAKSVLNDQLHTNVSGSSCTPRSTMRPIQGSATRAALAELAGTAGQRSQLHTFSCFS